MAAALFSNTTYTTNLHPNVYSDCHLVLHPYELFSLFHLHEAPIKSVPITTACKKSKSAHKLTFLLTNYHIVGLHIEFVILVELNYRPTKKHIKKNKIVKT